MTAAVKMTTRELLARLRRHYIKPGDALPGGVFLPEVGWNGRTGGRADALYVGFTSTSGRLLVGHELKVSRADWRRELEKNGKADSWADQCHAWNIVAPSTDIVPPEEVPHGWGLLVVDPRTKTRLKTVIKATVHKDRQPSWDALRSILARTDTLRAQAIADVRKDALDKAREEITARQRNQPTQHMTPEQRDRLHALDRLEERLGVTVTAWSIDREDGVPAHQLGAALKLIADAERVTGMFPRYAIRDLEDAVAKLHAAAEAADQWKRVLA